MPACEQELCWYWTGDGRVCACAVMGIEPETAHGALADWATDCDHEWLDRPESDTRECLICGEDA